MLERLVRPLVETPMLRSARRLLDERPQKVGGVAANGELASDKVTTRLCLL
jgi:hypothetical protein